MQYLPNLPKPQHFRTNRIIRNFLWIFPGSVFFSCSSYQGRKKALVNHPIDIFMYLKQEGLLFSMDNWMNHLPDIIYRSCGAYELFLIQKQ